MIRSIVEENNRCRDSDRPNPEVYRTCRRRNGVTVVVNVGNVRTIRVVYHIRCGGVVVSMGKLRTKNCACIRSDRGCMIRVKIATAAIITPTTQTGDFNLTTDRERGTNLPVITGRHDNDNTIMCVCMCAVSITYIPVSYILSKHTIPQSTICSLSKKQHLLSVGSCKVRHPILRVKSKKSLYTFRESRVHHTYEA